MVLNMERALIIHYRPDDRIRKDLLESMLWAIGVGEILEKGFTKNPKAWLEANATKEYVEGLYICIREGEIREMTMNEMETWANVFREGYSYAQSDISMLFEVVPKGPGEVFKC